MILSKTYNLTEIGTLSNLVLKNYIQYFWNDVFKPLHVHTNNIHLMLLCKVEFLEPEMGYRTLGDLRKVNYSDRELFTNFLVDRLGKLNDEYQVKPIGKIIFTYIPKEGVAQDNRLLLTPMEFKVKTHVYNGLVLPLSMDPNDYGKILSTTLKGTEDVGTAVRGKAETDTQEVSANKLVHIIENSGTVFEIQVSDEGRKNETRIISAADIKWIDTKLSDNSFKRELTRNTMYISNGEKVVNAKQLNAKPIKTVKMDSKTTSPNSFATIDIETVLHDNEQHPYLICGYTQDTKGGDKYIQSYAKSINPTDRTEMFNSFISQLLEFKDVKKIYAHNLSGFDGILLLEHLINFEGFEVQPLIFNGKLISIRVKYKTQDKTVRRLVFKDSYLLLNMSLRKLCDSFGVDVQKGNFPFLFSNPYYVGQLPFYHYWGGISYSDYQILENEYRGKIWSFKDEAIKYCKLDCKCLFEVLVKFNELVFKEFKIDIHTSLSL
jgi:hypothetical protein